MDESLAQMHFDAALAALDAHYQAMPPVAAMQLRIAGFDGDVGLSIRASHDRKRR